jgi:hypothetical protein
MLKERSLIMTNLSSTRIARNALSLALLAGVSACAGTREPPYPIPDEPGIYAFTTEDELHRLDGDREWEEETWPERSNMPSNVHFVIYEPALAGRSAGNTVQLWRVAWVRSEINAQGQAMPISGNEWAVAPFERFSVPFRYESPPGETEIVHIVPTVPLQPGLYDVTIPGAREARVGVTWNSVDQRQYAAQNCVDRYDGNFYRTCPVASEQPTASLPRPADPSAAGITEGGALASLGAPSSSAPPVAPAPTSATPSVAPAPASPAPSAAPAPTTAQQPAVPVSAEGLQISLLDPVRRNGGLIIQGVVTNTSSEMRAIPTMQGSLETSTGQEVRRWEFRPQVTTLGPGERANFNTEVRPVPPGVARASVSFIASSR